MTYLQILRLLERYAWNQPDVHSVVREFTDLNRETAQYAAVVIQDRDGERDLITDQDWITYTWHIGYVDRLWEEKNDNNYGTRQMDGFGSYSFYSNRDDIYSQGIRVINNIIAGLRKDYDLEITTPDRINTFNQRFTAECAGVYMVVAVTVPVSDCEDSGVESMYDSLNQRFTANGTYHFVPEGKPWNGADIEIDVHPEESLIVSFTNNGIYDLEGEWKDARIDVDVPGRQKPEESLIETITENGDYSYSPQEGYVFSGVSLGVDVHPSTSLSETYVSNGIYDVSGEFNGGQVTVAVPQVSQVPVDINISENGVTGYSPLSGYAYNFVSIYTNVHPSTSLSETYTSNGVYNISGEFNGGQVTVSVSEQKPEESLVETITSNGSYSYSPQPGYVFDSVALSVDVHPSQRLTRTYTTNGSKDLTGEWKDGTINIDVHPSTSLSVSYSSNGVYPIQGEFNGGEITVAVSAQKPEESLVETITSNGSYSYSPQPGYVFDSVSLSVDVHPSTSLSRSYYTNGTKVIDGEFNGGTITISVHPSNSLTRTYINDGVYNISGEFNGGTITVQTGVPKPANNEIYYVTYTGGVIDQLTNVNDFGANMISNTVHSSGKYCILTFDGPVLRTGANSFSNKLSLKEIYLPDSVTEISQNSFGNTGLQKCIMQNTVTVLKGFAFSDCYALVSPFRITTGCTVIGDYYGGVFRNCTALSTITIPALTTDIGPSAFSGCLNLLNIIVHPTTPPTLELSSDQLYHQFDDCGAGFKIRVPANSLQAYKTAPGWSVWEEHIIANDN